MPDSVLGGLSLPPFITSVLLACIVYLILHLLLNRLGIYRLVWHPGLFKLACFILLLAGVTLIRASF